MSLAARLNRPEYLFNPRAVLGRLREGRRVASEDDTTKASLPWSQQIIVFSDDIGRMIVQTGVFDLCATETIHRLTGRGDLAVDVGANVGYMTNLMATRAGPTGAVVAIEPHPAVFAVLARNASRWLADPEIGSVDARRLALSTRTGEGVLESPDGPEAHMGLSALRGTGAVPSPGGISVELGTLDGVVADREPQLLKIDVEGHELEVLEGGRRLLEGGGVRDIVFEEHAIYPAPSMTLLEDHGMTLFTLRHSPVGLRVRPIRDGPAPAQWPGPNYLATREPERALRLLGPRGWQSLGGVARLGAKPA